MSSDNPQSSGDQGNNSRGDNRRGSAHGNDHRGSYNSGRGRNNSDHRGRNRDGYRDGNRDGKRSYNRNDRRWDNDDRNDRRNDRRGGGKRDYNRDDRRRNDRRWDDDRRNDRRDGQDYNREDSRSQGNRNDRRGNNQKQTVRRGRVESESGRWRQRSYSPQRSGYREDRLNERANDPAVPDDIDVRDLDPLVLQDLKVLSRDNANAVAKHLIMAATWMADDPELALRHARAAKHRAGRVAVVRESNGIAAYHAGEWKEALSELRAARRMSGSDDLIAVMADCERGLGRPERALELAREVDTRRLPREAKVELLIVVAGARRDLGQNDAAVTVLERANPRQDAADVEGIRLAYAYADALVARDQDGDKQTAKQWFASIAANDVDGITDAEDRVAEL